MNLNELPEGLPANITKFNNNSEYEGWIVRKLNKNDLTYKGWILEKIDDSSQTWSTNFDFISDKCEVELDYNTPFSIRYLPEGYVAEIVSCSDGSNAHVGDKVKIIKSANPPYKNILVEAISTEDSYTKHNYWTNLQELKDNDVFQLKLVNPIENELIEPILEYKGIIPDIKPFVVANNPTSKKAKFDFTSFFAQFVKLTLEIKQKDQFLFESIVKKICHGTSHNNLIEFNNDTNIDVLTKVNIYTAAICAIKDSKILNFEKPKLVMDEYNDDAIRKQYDHLATQFNQLNEKCNTIQNGFVASEKIREQQLTEIEELKKNAPQILQIVDRILTDKGEGIECLDETRIKAQIGPEERFHNQLLNILKILKIRNARGFTEFIWLWGAPGSGKTHLGEQISRGLSLTYYPFPADPTVTAGKLLGFNNIATGTFIQGWLYKPYKEGGLAFIDEGDLMDASCFAGANSIENAYFTFGNGERVERHKDFYLIVSANTKGTGATKGFQRNKLDAATLNRFTMIELEYDEDLEKKIYGNSHWAEYVHKVRKYCNNTFKETVHITSRPIRKGAAYLTDKTISREYICDITLFCLMTKDQKQQVINNVGVYQDISIIDVNQDATLYFTELRQSIKNQFKLPNDKVNAVRYLREQINQKMGIISGPVYASKAIGDLNGFIQCCQSLGEFPKEYHNTPIDK